MIGCGPSPGGCSSGWPWRAVLHRPSILLPDEPYTGLDPQAADALSALLGELAGERCTLLLTTHDLGAGYLWATG